MALREEEQKLPARYLFRKGVPAFLFAVFVSVIIHFLAHLLVGILSSRSAINIENHIDFITNAHPAATVAGPISTFVIALVSFWYFLHNPGNLFAASLAFVNASTRLIETISVFFQMLIHKKTTLVVDESLSLSIIPLSNPTLAVVFLCFLSLSLIILTLIIVHDSKGIPYKWLVASVLFILTISLEKIIWQVFRLLV